jgi:hypothetical protein
MEFNLVKVKRVKITVENARKDLKLTRHSPNDSNVLNSSRNYTRSSKEFHICGGAMPHNTVYYPRRRGNLLKVV